MAKVMERIKMSYIKAIRCYDAYWFAVNHGFHMLVNPDLVTYIQQHPQFIAGHEDQATVVWDDPRIIFLGIMNGSAGPKQIYVLPGDTTDAET